MNTRPCATCRHMDARVLPSGVAYCWRFFKWVAAGGTVKDCDGAERADGRAPPGQLRFPGEQVRG